ncbi:uncharacterized protein LOC143741781 isoform X2 [Siphateles boraxobius]|uniref:uncharacterized protein LOC143741781 isoform X2 n=1 Tax=Siphateles boraxobius TaxID=180520 RepID=UPI004063A88F
MNSMFSVWTLSSLILSYTLAFPIFNNTRGSYMETFPNVTENMENNKTRLMKNMDTFSNVTERNFTEFNTINQTSVYLLAWNLRCSLPSCILDNLVDRIQNGDEEAGKSTLDPWGPGKK